ncbi:hypothetical protein M622_17810 [Thauera terpenica 58Eu]|uniref:Uncharacterized protein n=1 Tax=Thauera terpenica 58Eu TaxID=1348657 RepID=S9ZBR5_9RHOO|nr:hypothetical protein M622_17810 [Thauera terpenica 58Eu]
MPTGVQLSSGKNALIDFLHPLCIIKYLRKGYGSMHGQCCQTCVAFRIGCIRKDNIYR